MDGHVSVTSGTVTQQHRHCSTVGGVLLRHEYTHPTSMKAVTRLFDYGEIPTSDDIDISTVTDSNIDQFSLGNSFWIHPLVQLFDCVSFFFAAWYPVSFGGEARLREAYLDDIGGNVMILPVYI